VTPSSTFPFSHKMQENTSLRCVAVCDAMRIVACVAVCVAASVAV